MMYSQYPHNTKTGQKRGREKEQNTPHEAKLSEDVTAENPRGLRAGSGERNRAEAAPEDCSPHAPPGRSAPLLPFPAAVRRRAKGGRSHHLPPAAAPGQGGRGRPARSPGCAGAARVSSAKGCPPQSFSAYHQPGLRRPKSLLKRRFCEVAGVGGWGRWGGGVGGWCWWGWRQHAPSSRLKSPEPFASTSAERKGREKRGGGPRG